MARLIAAAARKASVPGQEPRPRVKCFRLTTDAASGARQETDMLKTHRHRRRRCGRHAELGRLRMASAEKAGENADSAIEEATQGQENLGDGPLEQAGEGVDEATGNQQNNDAADAVNDATDGNSSTNP